MRGCAVNGMGSHCSDALAAPRRLARHTLHRGVQRHRRNTAAHAASAGVQRWNTAAASRCTAVRDTYTCSTVPYINVCSTMPRTYAALCQLVHVLPKPATWGQGVGSRRHFAATGSGSKPVARSASLASSSTSKDAWYSSPAATHGV
jgi:hypothetical protein